MKNKINPPLALPNDYDHLLLHSCCAPCSGAIIEALAEAGVRITIFFYNPNIHPQREYEIRKNEHKRFAEKHNIPFFDGDYDRKEWFERIKGFENEPERGERCTKCFDMRLECTALFAHENKIPIFSTSLGFSRWKDLNQVTQSALRAASRYDNVMFWEHNWRKGGGTQRGIEISKHEHFYKQEYCGCVFSLRDTNKWREQNGRAKIEIGEIFYE